MHRQQPKWIIAPPDRNLSVPFLKAIPFKALDNDRMEFQAETEKGKITVIASLKDTFEMSKGQLHQDMCEMNILNQPEVLNNIVERYKKDEIFTYIGPTLIAVNPYRVIEKLFNKKLLSEMRDNIINGNLKDQIPHVYLIAGKAYNAMIYGDPKQAIVISGESGAGKTQSTKYCMQIITSLSHKESHSVQKRILACNPLLEAFGNSKTVRNDNSSRFGKYVQIFFGSDNTIKGANIISYLLQKSRVVSVANGERTFHAFYALTASKLYQTKEASSYNYLKQSGCFTASNIDDKKYFEEINESMSEIGFEKAEQEKIWRLLNAILSLGDLEFDDKKHLVNESDLCQIINKDLIPKIASNLGISAAHLEKVLLSEKKIILKQTSHKSYNKIGCVGNRNTLSKAVYNAIFEFIIFKIENSLNTHVKETQLKSINILDIFGFQNFQENSFEQLCINFTNQKLLKQYNKYIFENQMQILKEDGLQKQIMNIKAPTNDDIISLISGKLSLFSIINDNTSGQQYKDQDILHGLEKDFKDKNILKFDKINKNKFTIVHSQCEVCYNVDGFRLKNQDKVNSEIEEIVVKLFVNQNRPQVGKTLLHKFVKQIDDLVTELGSSSNHFIRCIKPNQKKISNLAEQNYILIQVRYLGVFQTIQIRQKTFPSRKTYDDFAKTYSVLFQNLKGKNPKQTTKGVFKELKASQKQYLLGTKRVYVSKEVDEKLNKELFKFFKIKNQKAIKIQKLFRTFRYRKNIFVGLKKLVLRKNLWRKFAAKQTLIILAFGNAKIREYSVWRKKLIEEQKKKALLQAKRAKQKVEMEQNKNRTQKIVKCIPKLEKICVRIAEKSQLSAFTLIKSASSSKTKNYQTSKKQEQQRNHLDETDIVSDSVIDHQSPYKPNVIPAKEDQSEHVFNSSYIEGNSVYISEKQGVVFQKNIVIDLFNPEGGNIEKLQKILAQQYKLEITGNQEQFFSPNSADCNFRLEDTPSDLLNKIICFASEDFFNKVLRKRTTFIGMKKSYNQILVSKPRPLTKTLTLIPESDEQKALKVFKVIVRIGEEAKLDNVFKLIENMISLCQTTSQELKNQIFLQLIKQCNTSYELASIRIFQSIAVFLHIYTPDSDFIMAGLNLFFQKLGQQKHSQKQEQYIRYLFKKMIRKIENPPIIGYMPIKYQMMALMCKRQISIPIYLPVGNSILIKVESYDTFADIKARVIEEFGINKNRFRTEMFKFFEIVNFQNQELEESPLNESQIVWDIMTYWELAKDKYKQTNINPPAFFLMLKIVYAFECHEDDIQGIELSFAQCYFDYFIGRIKLDFDEMGGLAGCVKKIKLSSRPQNQIMGSFPIWMAKQHERQKLAEIMMENVRHMQAQKLTLIDMKYRFLQICSHSPLAMSMAIPTEQPIKLFFKPKKIYLAEKCKVVEEHALRSIVKWAIDKQKFVFDIKNSNGESRTHAIFTQFAHICSQYLYDLSKVLKRN